MCIRDSRRASSAARQVGRQLLHRQPGAGRRQFRRHAAAVLLDDLRVRLAVRRRRLQAGLLGPRRRAPGRHLHPRRPVRRPLHGQLLRPRRVSHAGGRPRRLCHHLVVVRRHDVALLALRLHQPLAHGNQLPNPVAGRGYNTSRHLLGDEVNLDTGTNFASTRLTNPSDL